MTQKRSSLGIAVAMVASLSITPVLAQTTWYVVDDNCPGPGSGTLADPFCTIQQGIDASTNGDTVQVADGTYTGAGNKDLDFGGRAITLRSENGPDNCTIDCENTGRAFHFHSGETEASVVEGFTITGGYAADGGGMLNDSSSPTVRNCVFNGNTATDSGAGISNINSSPTVTNCTFNGNHSGGGGGGMYNDHSNPALTDCTFIENSAADGGGMWNQYDSSPMLINCQFLGNTAGSSFNPGGGGVLNADNSNPTLINCLFVGNSATDATHDSCYGGGMYNYNSSPVLINCTFSQNMSDDWSGGMYSYGSNSNPTLINCIFWANSDADGTDESAQIHDGSGSASAIARTCIQGLDTFAGNGNIGDDPLFADADLRLGPGSPCIDAGDTTAVPLELFIDLDGRGRVRDDPTAPDTGIPAGLMELTVDMGAYESPVPGDVNGDGWVDLVDFALFTTYFTGPNP